MVGPRRPQFVLFGSSIVQQSFRGEGWGSILADIYARKADIFVRGYDGWNSRQALQVLDQVFPKDDAVQPSLVIVYFGGNDSQRLRPDGLGAHVPLSEYIENIRKIAIHLKGFSFTVRGGEWVSGNGSKQSLSENTRVVFLSAPPINEAQLQHVWGIDGANERRQKYADACVELCQEMGITAINLCNAFRQHDNWMATCFTDGVHFSATGSKIVAKEILKVLEEADWKPNLYWEALPVEFSLLL